MILTAILIKRNGEVLYIERDIWARGPIDPSTDRVFRFKLAIVTP